MNELIEFNENDPTESFRHTLSDVKIVTVKTKKQNSFSDIVSKSKSFFKSAFLPIGYPSTVNTTNLTMNSFN